MSIIRYIRGDEFTFGNCLTETGLQKLLGFIGSYADIFVDELDNSFCVTNRNTFSISTEYCFNSWNTCSLSNYQNQILEGLINKYLANGILQHSDSPWSSPAKPVFYDGDWHLKVDYNDLNAITYYQGVEVPRVRDVIESIDGHSEYFSKIVVLDGFHQMKLAEHSRSLTAFETDFGRFEFTRMHTGLKNASRLLQQLIENILNDIDGVGMYLGHILVSSDNQFDHFETLKTVLWRLRNANLKLDRQNCEFFVQNLVYLSYSIRSGGATIHRSKLGQILNFGVPQNLHQLRQFLGMTSQHKDLINNYDSIAWPLNRLTSTSSFFYWNWQHQNAYDALINGFTDLLNGIGISFKLLAFLFRTSMRFNSKFFIVFIV